MEGRMAKIRDTYKYQFKVGNKIVHVGITKDLEHREKEHQQNRPKGRIKQVGHRTTEEAARTWEKEKLYSAKYLDPQPPPGTGSVSRAQLRRAILKVTNS